MRILLADSNHPVLYETLRSEGHTCDLFWDKSVEELTDLLPSYNALVIRSRFKVTRELMDKCPDLKCIGRVGAGMENIDVLYARDKKIACVNSPEGNRDAVGEHALGMLLMLMNNLKKADAEVRNNIWLRAENRGYEITGKTIGIIGYGNMGSSFAGKLLGFDCKILVYDKYRKGFGTNKVLRSEMRELFDQCDIVSIHVPLIKETEDLVNAEFIRKFKKPIYIINTARGKCLNTSDLVEGLKNGKVRGACLDVLEYESSSFEKVEKVANTEANSALEYLIASDKVILTPHIAGWTHESNYKMSKVVAEKMNAILKNLS
ncbi:MAG: hydroxyacid dehydrogenase [Bacteroidetes bacterium]|nr:hydroxyacid dehydrogenase [Bacteroidota bacterium]